MQDKLALLVTVSPDGLASVQSCVHDVEDVSVVAASVMLWARQKGADVQEIVKLSERFNFAEPYRIPEPMVIT